jgi:hypothetical protein
MISVIVIFGIMMVGVSSFFIYRGIKYGLIDKKLFIVKNTRSNELITGKKAVSYGWFFIALGFLCIGVFIFVAVTLSKHSEGGKATESITPAEYAQALEAANSFLWAWSNRDVDTGTKLISHNLIAELKKNNKDDWFKQYMSGLSNPHHISFEIGKCREINSNRFAFTVTLFEHYTGERNADKYRSTLEVIKEEGSWRIDVLPTSSDS